MDDWKDYVQQGIDNDDRHYSIRVAATQLVADINDMLHAEIITDDMKLDEIEKLVDKFSDELL